MLAIATNDGAEPEIGGLLVSTDSGDTWEVADAPLAGWSAVACSADGSTLVAAGDEGICISDDDEEAAADAVATMLLGDTGWASPPDSDVGVLQRSRDLGVSERWQDTFPVPRETPGQFEFTLPADEVQGYFRLVDTNS